MAASNPRTTANNTISGKIILKETGIGIPDLLVVIYDLDPGIRHEEEEFRLPEGIQTELLGDRIGSVLSDKEGNWSLTYDDSEFRILSPTEKRPDLQLYVLAPEDSDFDGPALVLYKSKIVRVNSGRSEASIIRITSAKLEEAKIKLPGTAEKEESIESKVQKYRKEKLAQKALRDRYKEVNNEIDELEQEEKNEFRNNFKQVILPDLNKLSPKIKVVKGSETVEEVQQIVFTEGVKDINDKIGVIEKTADNEHPLPGKGIKINLFLTNEEKAELQQYKFSYENKDYYDIPENEIKRILFKRESNDGLNAALFSNNPISKFCIQKSSDDKCASRHVGIFSETGHDLETDDSDDDNNNTLPQNTGITKEDIPLYLENILANKNSNHYQTDKDYKSERPNEKSVQEKVDSFALQKGPAETTAFYDFHSLQIAFQYIWQQLLDETLVNLSEKINNDLQNSGKRGLNSRSFEALKSFAAELLTEVEVPNEVSASFDISLIEYNALSLADQNELKSLGSKVYFNEQMINGSNLTVDQSDNLASYVFTLREQGERIIDNIRNNKPFSTNQLLKDLHEKLMSKYEFTVFAADKNYHSINFGLMNTYRQKWEPISYQAGKLVKTIPLSPKEERKYSVKTVQNIKTTRKQAQKNNSSLTQEINTTSRAESEILAKAQDKSNFNMSVKLDYSKISSEVSYGKEAAKESSQSRKDFREAVIKAAQEFKEERSLEIDTEENYSSEYNESGTIVNPNDELSVTYLFYELQRRYRISEQLYRVMPVVMVAQEVPSPGQITEAWIISNDWIINRALLDDSFRPALQYLAQKNVGDDFAIRELRKNLRQQRSLVNRLQLEFSKLKQEVANKYAAMENAVRERINEEHLKRTYRWWLWWNDPNRPDDKPDPEMAKALEQAATDEHKYAIEKAEKMALSVQREVNALHQLTTDYNNVMREHLDRITQTKRLITHIKNNILYYMQAIWSMEPPDQRYMRLYKVMVPHFEADRTCIVEDQVSEDIFANFRRKCSVAEGEEIDEDKIKKKYGGWLHGKIKRKADGTPDVTYKQLVEVADLDTMLGFKGNYMIFPLKQHNALTELMAAPYIDDAFGAMDPDELSNINLEELSKYICCLHDNDPKEFECLKPVLKIWLEKLLADPLRNGDEIIVPTGSLFIEMLPSSKSLLEDFKLKHREWDVYKVQAEVRKMELENIRYAARLLNSEREDPDVDKKIIVEGNGVNVDLDVN